MPDFCHLHVHSQYSLLDGQATISSMVKKAKDHGMKAMALTDHGNMFGAFEFYNAAKKIGIQPVLGCEFYLVEDMYRKSFTPGTRDNRFHQLLLARNEYGYQNLSRLCSLGYIDGLYSKYPRIDKNLIRKHREGLIATTCCIGAEIPQAILHKGPEAAEKLFLEWREIFGDDYFIELQRHNLQNIDGTGMSQEDVNQVLLGWSRKYGVPVIATNDSHYTERSDYSAHDTLLCINIGEYKATPVGDEKGQRFGFANDQFYFKTGEEMAELFHDIPEAVENTVMVLERIDTPNLNRDLLMPAYTLPPGFETQADYLRHLTYEGARKKYGEISGETAERINFELNTIIDNKFEGYFLIVQDFTTEARNMGVWVGPGRGSAAGSVVAYCLGITNVDPIKYDLLFERFLNPERVSMPDIDIDFDDQGRDRVLTYVANKYGQRQMAQIVTYGTMAARSSIKDVGRVLQLTPKETDKLSKMVPGNVSLKEILEKDMKYFSGMDTLKQEELGNIQLLQQLGKGNDLVGETLKTAKELEGSVRSTGVHACGVIIAPDDLTNFIPVATSKESPYLLAQFDVNLIESAGLLKMDFLGLRTLSIIKDAIRIIQERHGIEIDPDTIPLDDPKTYELYQRGETNGTFQFESPGMQKYLKELKPTQFGDLIAMNALYRPGPLKYIPEFIRRKLGQSPIRYDLPVQEELLRETYGITVYQEQVMLLSQRLAGFSKGKADELRKAMGKKKKEIIDKLKPEFIEGCTKNGFDPAICEKIWSDWEEFASYAFNKSHSTCYSVVAFQTAYLKANYPAEYMAAVLANNMGDIKKVTFFMEECRRMGLKVLGPDINESRLEFSVNAQGEIRFGLGAIKGVGQAAAEELLAERERNGDYSSIFDLCARVNLRAVNKRALESMALAGSFDFDQRYNRAHYVRKASEREDSGIEMAIRYGTQLQAQKASSQGSLFGGDSAFELAEPKLPQVEAFSLLEELKEELEVVGVYISKHPLDIYRFEYEILSSVPLADLESFTETDNYQFSVVGMVTSKRELLTKKGEPFCIFTMEDYSGSHEFRLYSRDYMNFKNVIEKDYFLFLKGKITKSRGKDGAQDFYRMTIENIQLLSQTNTRVIRTLVVEADAKKVDEILLDALESAMTEFTGNTPVQIVIKDEESSYDVELLAEKGVNICSELKDFLDSMSLKYKFLKN
ncbi:MAG: DNA polymerase III subunit alpha [Bacteroidetes bacterium]|nr:DNA polymerase III subunit alpha [Bacteroidota bacterium]